MVVLMEPQSPSIPVVLASTSIYRQQLLDRLGFSYSIAAPGVNEERLEGESPAALVARLAEAKARAVAKGFPNALIIGSDQVAVLDEDVLGKPGNHQAAVEQLRRASGRELCFLTGLALLDGRTGRVEVSVVPFCVLFRTLSEGEIQRYLRREQPYDCAGSFKSEGLGIALFARMVGDDPTALMGLPLICLTSMFNKVGVGVV